MTAYPYYPHTFFVLSLFVRRWIIYNCPGLTCGINIVKPRFLFKTVDLWSYILPIDTHIRSKRYKVVYF